MNWRHETWRKLYCREEGAFACLPLYVRGYFSQLIKLANDDGVVEMRHENDELWRVVAMRAGADATDRQLLRRALTMLEEAGVIFRRGAGYVLRDWDQAQDRKKTPHPSKTLRGPSRDLEPTLEGPSADLEPTLDRPSKDLIEGKSAESLKTASVVPSVPFLPDVPSRTPSESSAEPAKPASPPVLEFPCVGTGAKTWSLTEAFLAELKSGYPDLDVDGACRAARTWAVANPSKRKTAGGMPRFLANWLATAQNRGEHRRDGVGPPQRSRFQSGRSSLEQRAADVLQRMAAKGVQP